MAHTTSSDAKSRKPQSFGADRFGNANLPGVSYFRNRTYDSRTGRWMQEDPLGVAGGVNLYQFNGNDPVQFSDPFGLCIEDACVVEAGIALAAVGTAALVTTQALAHGSDLRGAGRAGISAAGGLVRRATRSAKIAAQLTVGTVVHSARTKWQKIKTAIGIGVGLANPNDPQQLPRMPSEEPPPPPERIAPAPPGGGKSPVTTDPDGTPRITFPLH